MKYEKSAKLKTPKTTTVKVWSMVPACGANFSKRRKNYEDCMYRSTFGRIMVETGKTQFCCHSKTKNRMESRLSSVGLLIIVRKKINAKIFF